MQLTSTMEIGDFLTTMSSKKWEVTGSGVYIREQLGLSKHLPYPKLPVKGAVVVNEILSVQTQKKDLKFELGKVVINKPTYDTITIGLITSVRQAMKKKDGGGLGFVRIIGQTVTLEKVA